MTREEQCLEVDRGDNCHPYRSYTLQQSLDKATIQDDHNIGRKWTLPPPTGRNLGVLGGNKTKKVRLKDALCGCDLSIIVDFINHSPRFLSFGQIRE